MTALRFTTWQSPYKPGHRQMLDLSGAAYRRPSIKDPRRMPDGTGLSSASRIEPRAASRRFPLPSLPQGER